MSPHFDYTRQSVSRSLNTMTRIDVVVPSVAGGAVDCGIPLLQTTIGLLPAAATSAACFPESSKGQQVGLARKIAYLRDPGFSTLATFGSPREYAPPAGEMFA